MQGADPRRRRDGHAADPDALAARTLPSLSTQLGKHLGVNGDHVAAIEYDPTKVRSVLGLPGYGQFYKGKPITTMTYDFWVGRRGHRYDGTRFTLQEIFLSSLTNFLYDDGRAPAGDPSWWGLQKKRAIATGTTTSSCWRWSRTPTTASSTPRRRPAAARCGRTPGRSAIGPFNYALSEQSVARARGGQRGDAADRRAPRPRRAS